MELFEYEGKTLLASHGIPVSRGIVLPSLAHVEEAAAATSSSRVRTNWIPPAWARLPGLLAHAEEEVTRERVLRRLELKEIKSDG